MIWNSAYIFSRGIISILLFACVPVFASESLLSSVKYATNATGASIERREPMMFTLLGADELGAPFTGLSLLVDISQYAPRGRLTGKTINLSPHIDQDTEFIKIFVHELGHFIDIYLLRKTLFSDDPSKDFYAISWKEPKIKHTGQSYQSFVSGYAATNQWEDFAESFVWYIFHNQDFADKALTNPQIKQKYLFFARSVFPWQMFQGTDFSIEKQETFVWDTSKTQIYLKKYLSFLKK